MRDVSREPQDYIRVGSHPVFRHLHRVPAGVRLSEEQGTEPDPAGAGLQIPVDHQRRSIVGILSYRLGPLPHGQTGMQRPMMLVLLPICNTVTNTIYC